MRKSFEEIEYQPKLDLLTTQKAIKFLKEEFQKILSKNLNLTRVSAPLFVKSSTGLNDDLNGVERPVSFKIDDLDEDIEIVQSLAKWKRAALKRYDFQVYQGLYTDMNAIRKDEEMDFFHSIYVDQWDWELIINKEDRNLKYLNKIVKKIYHSIYLLKNNINKKYSQLTMKLPKSIYFISTKKLEKLYPNLSRKEREDLITKEKGAVFIYQIGSPLKDGFPHDNRAADYDDWSLNGDLLIYYPLYEMALEISSMGIRVDENSLVNQLKYKNEIHKLSNRYCQEILNKNLPYTIGGGIGQSRLCMLLLEKAHIGETQVSVWSEKEKEKLKRKHIEIL